VIALLYSKQNWHTNAATDISIASQRKVYLGAWVGGFWDSKTKTLTTSAVTNFEQLIGKKVAIANIYSEWTYLSNKDLITVLNKFSDKKWTPMISSNPSFFDGCPKGKDSLYKTIASGECDIVLKEVATNLRSYKKPIFLRFAWEMNLPDMYWSVSKGESTPEEFTAAWRHFHEILKEEGADNVKWVLSFNTTNSNTIPYVKLYPGDEYVDWVAIDGYNWGNSHAWSGWANFNGVFRKSYNELVAISEKPVMLSEVNSAPTGGDKASWLHDMLITQIPEEFPQVEAIVFFNENKTGGESVDWRLEKSPEYVTVVKEALKDELYRSSYP
jgi:beta-mannanase